jgi:opacity protein-like surface antigen
MKKLLLLVVLAVMFIATPVMAKEGMYLGAGLVFNNIVGSDVDVYDPAGGFDLRIGRSFGSIAIEGNVLRVAHMGKPGFADADMTGVNLDLRVSFSQTQDPDQVYLLVGLGAYTLDLSNGNDFSGTGLNLGAGMEHFFNDQVSLNLAAIYRFIDYTDATIGGIDYTLDPAWSGDAFSLHAGINLYF